ncbi:hypothetical protein [Helicobacter sp. 23-1046]
MQKSRQTKSKYVICASRFRASLSIEMLFAIIIFGIIGVVCASVSLNFTRFIAQGSLSNVLDSHIAILKIQNLLAKSVGLHITHNEARFYIPNTQKLFGYGDKTFSEAKMTNGTLLPSIPLKIAHISDRTAIFASSVAEHTFSVDENMLFVCGDSTGAMSEFITQIVAVSVAKNAITLKSSPPKNCKIALPLESPHFHLSHSLNTLWLNGEVLLNGVSDFSLTLLPSNFLHFRFCVAQKCFEGGSIINAQITSL